MATTLLQNVINPEVMADMLSAELENGLVVTGFYEVDRTLVGRPGDTITVPTWQYIGEADDLAENQEGTVTTLEATSQDFTVKKAVKNVQLTDETALSGYGDPVGEATNQLRLSVQDKIDSDGITELQGITPSTGLVSDATGAVLNYDAVVDAIDLLNLEEQGTELYLLTNKTTLKNLRKDPEWKGRESLLGDSVLTTGVVGSIGGALVRISNKLADTESYILTPNCLTAFLKRDVTVETARGEDGVLHKRTLISADAHYTVAIKRYDKIVQIMHD